MPPARATVGLVADAWTVGGQVLAKGGSIGQKEEKREIPQKLVDLAKQLQAASEISGAKDFAMEKALELQDQIQTECNNFLAGPPYRVTAACCAPACCLLRTTHRPAAAAAHSQLALAAAATAAAAAAIPAVCPSSPHARRSVHLISPLLLLLSGTPVAAIFNKAVANKDSIRMLYRWLKTVAPTPPRTPTRMLRL